MNKIDLLFNQDDERTLMLKNDQYKAFKKSYLTKSQVTNSNTAEFWTEKIMAVDHPKDFMMEDRLSIVSNIVNEHNGELINIGVGRGLLEERIDKNRFNITGLDITLDGLVSSAKSYKLRPVLADINNLPFKGDIADVVTVLEVLEHLRYDQIIPVLMSIKRLIKKKDGKLIVSVPVNETYSSRFNPNAHVRRYSKEIILQELQMTGFQINKVVEFYAFSTHYKIKKQLSKIVNIWKPNDLVIVSTTKP